MADKTPPIKGKIVKPGKATVIARLAARKAVRGVGKLFGKGAGAVGEKINKNYSVGVEAWIDTGKWVKVKSSNVSGIKYDVGNHWLYVEFKSSKYHGGSVYLYSNVPVATARNMFLAPSMGKYVWKALRDRFPYKRIL